MKAMKNALCMALVCALLAVTAAWAQPAAEATGALPAATLEPGMETQPTEEELRDYGAGLLGERSLTQLELDALGALWGYARRVDELDVQLDQALSQQGQTVDWQALRTLEQQGEALEDELDRYEDTLKASLRAGDFDRETYQALKDELERMDDELDDFEDLLEVYWDD